MQRPDLSKQKIKRILVFYNELERMKVNHEAAMELMEYVFSVSTRWMDELLRKHELTDYNDITLQHIEIDMMMIDGYISKIHKTGRVGRKQRTKQTTLF